MKRTIILRDADPAVNTAAATPAVATSASATRSRKLRPVLTLLCALIADGLQWILPFFWPVWDGAMVIAILVLWGWRWEILVAVIPELIPGLELAPTWTIFAGYLVLGRRHDPAQPK
jgi:hypothetical protein